MIDKFKRNPYVLLGSIISLGLGLYFILGNAGVITYLIFSLIGILLILLGISNLLNLRALNENDSKEYVYGIITIVFGILVMTTAKILLIIAGAYLLIEVIIKVIKSPEKKQQFIHSGPKIGVGILLIALSFQIVNQYIFWCVGAFLIFIACFLIYVIITEKSLMLIMTNLFLKTKINNPKYNNRNNRDDIIDVEE